MDTSSKSTATRRSRIIYPLAFVALVLTAYLVTLAVTDSSTPPSLDDISDGSRFLGATQTTYSSTVNILKTHVRSGTRYYVEGLLFRNATHLVESAGLYGQSGIHMVSLANMAVGPGRLISSKYFGEGIGLVSNSGAMEIWQLTWKERDLLVHDANSLKYKRTMKIPSVVKEGWGMAVRNVTVSGSLVQEIWMTDGSANIYVFDKSLALKKTLTAKTSDRGAINQLNEIEFVEGKLLANVYMTSNILVINPATGFVETVLDCSKFKNLAIQQANKMGLSIQSDEVLNGIAYWAPTKKLIITGKKWPVMWEIGVPGLNA